MELPEVSAPVKMGPCCHLLPGLRGALGFSCSLPHAIRFAEHLPLMVITHLCISQLAAWGSHPDGL